MKILEENATPNSERVRIFLAEKNINIPFEQVNSSEADHNFQTFHNIRPFQKVPAIILDNGEAISEVSAICRYLEEVQPEPGLMGEGAPERSRVEMWNKRLELYLFDFLYQQVLSDIPGWAEINRPKAEEAFSVLNEELATRPYIAGNSFTLADISAYIAIHALIKLKVSPGKELTHLEKWYMLVAARPGCRISTPEIQKQSA
ncbi:MAG: glutathione S-transferase family protein [Methyloligellaceae bacterium]